MRSINPVANDFVDAVVDLRRRQLWREVDPTAAFMIRHPDDPHPMAAVMPGADDKDFVFLIYRGPVAFADLVAKWRGGVNDGWHDLDDATSSLGVGFTTPDDLTSDERRLVRDARFSVGPDGRVPFAFSRPARRHARLPSRSELRVIADCARAVLATHAAGEFRPKPLDLKSAQILEVAIEFGHSGLVARAGMVRRPIYLESAIPRRGRAGEPPTAPEGSDAD